MSRDNRIASGWLLWVDEREVDMQQHREEIIDASSGAINAAGITVIGKGQRAGVGHWQVPYIKTTPSSDSTGSRGAALADLGEVEKWIALVREVEQQLPWKMAILLRLKQDCRNSHRGRWVAYCQSNYVDQVAHRLKKRRTDIITPSRNTLCEWWEKIVIWTVVKAAKNNLL